MMGDMNRRAFLHLSLLALAGCAVPPSPGASTPPQGGTAFPEDALKRKPTRRATQAGIPPETCHPALLIAPTRAAPLTRLDQTDDVGLHVINSALAVELDPLSYRLKLSGMVDNPLELTLDELRCMPKTTETVRLTCQGFFVDTTTYSGVPLLHILQLARFQDGAKGLHLYGAEGYATFVTLREALQADNFLAYQWEDQPLPIYHGFPLRAVIPGMLGYAWAKYLVEITLV